MAALAQVQQSKAKVAGQRARTLSRTSPSPTPALQAPARRGQTPLPALLPASSPAPAPQGHRWRHEAVPGSRLGRLPRDGEQGAGRERGPEQEAASTRGAQRAQRKANKRKQLRKLVSHSCASQTKSKAGGTCKGHWKNSSDVICPHRARLAQRKKNKLFTSWANQLSGWSTPGSAASEEAPNPSMPCSDLSPLHRPVALAGETLLKGARSHVATSAGRKPSVPDHACRELARKPPARLAGSRRAEQGHNLPLLGVFAPESQQG